MSDVDKRIGQIFDLADELDGVEKELIGGFPELSFLWFADDVLAWMERNYQLLSAELRVDPQQQFEQSHLSSMRANVLFHFGNYAASAQSGLDFLYNYGKNGVFTSELLQEVDKRTTELKKSAPQRVMTALRNRAIHVPPLLDALFASVRTEHDPRGRAAHLCPVLTERAIAGIDKEFPSDPAALSLWTDIKRQCAAREDWLTKLLDIHSTVFRQTFADAKALAQSTYSSSLAQYRQLETKREEIEKKLQQLGSFREAP